jgi:hypothetical protein
MPMISSYFVIATPWAENCSIRDPLRPPAQHRKAPG